MDEIRIKVFLSSPSDLARERDLFTFVADRLNGEFEGVARFEIVRWEDTFYSATQSFQEQIHAAVHGMAAVDAVVCLLWSRIGLKLNPVTWRREDGSGYESGTVFEYESATALSRKSGGAPRVYLFRKSAPIQYRAEAAAEDMEQHRLLEEVWRRWTQTDAGFNAAAFQAFADAEDFERKIEECLRQYLEFRGVLVKDAIWDRRLQGSPFRGLAAFEPSHAAVFFGRETALARSIRKLRTAPFLLVIGASGAGKSSLLRAGLIPRITRSGVIPGIDLWRTALILPDSAALAGLAEALFAEGALGQELRDGGVADAETLAPLLAQGGEAAIPVIEAALARAAERRAADRHYDSPRPARLLLAIDQIERLFAEATPAEIESFADVVRLFVERQFAVAIATLRSDAYGSLQAFASFMALHERGTTHDLLPPGLNDLEEIVTRPVAACHPALVFETGKNGKSLADVLVADAKGGDALPLLQVTLERLFEAEEKRGDGVLRFADYPGIEHAVTQAAAEAFASLDPSARLVLPALITGLIHDVAPDPTGGRPILTLRPLPRQAFEAHQPARAALVKAFIDHRLLMVDDFGDAARLYPVHEALLRAWPEAARIITENEAAIRTRRTLEPLVADWQRAAPGTRQDHLLTSPGLLAAAGQLTERLGDDVPAEMREFIQHSLAADAHRREAEERRRQQILASTARMKVGSSRLYFPLVLLLLAAMTAVRYFDPLFLQTLRSLAFDEYQIMTPASYDPQLPVRVVAIDQASLDKYGQWPWPRTRMRDLVTALTADGAAAIAFDLLFAEPDRLSPDEIVKTLPANQAALLSSSVASQPTNDQLFASALAQSPSVLSVSLENGQATPFVAKSGFAYAGDSPIPFLPAFAGADGSLPLLEQAAHGLGAANWVPDRDQVLRRVGLFYRVGGNPVPSLAAEALRVAQGASTYVIKSSNASSETAFGQNTGINHVEIGAIEIPTDANGSVTLRFRHSDPGAFIPAWRVLSGGIGRGDIAGRIIFIGADVPGLGDFHATPIDVAVPGVEIHAQVVENILAGRLLRRPDYALALEEVIVIAIGLGLAFLMPQVPARWLFVLLAAVDLLLLAGGWAAFYYEGVLLDPTYPILATGILITALTFFIYRYSEAQRGRIRRVFNTETP